MSVANVDAIARAVLYEGYMLYPYRRSTLKNQQRWTFGGVYPPAWCERGNGDRDFQRLECLVEGGADAAVEARVRCLHLIDRRVGRMDRDDPLEWTPVDVLDVDGTPYYPWQEATEREVVVPVTRLGDVMRTPLRVPFELAAARETERLLDAAGQVAGLLIRDRREIRGIVTISAAPLANDAWRVVVTTENQTDIAGTAELDRDAASLYSMASTHAVLSARDGVFASLIDPPGHLKQAARDCRQEGCFPVLVGHEGERDTLLASPIILYDYPQIAPESPGDLFDGTEIDEILSLRVLTMTDAEKAEMAAIDPHARELLERTESLTPEQWRRLHGAMRKLGPDSVPNLTTGARVRLKPKPGGDVMDMALAGKTAIVEGIDRDFENRVYVAVAVDDDPGRDLGLARMPGHRFFLALDEVEAL